MFYKKALDSGIKLGHNGWFSILGGVANTIEKVPVEDIVNAATSMLITIPSVEVAPQNNGGFRVRLGGKDDKDNFVYEVGEDGVKKHKVSDYQKEYDKIKSKVAEVNKNFLEDLLKNDKLSDEDKNKVKKDLEEFENNYKEKINTEDCIVFYGTRYKEEKANESFRSLYDYIMINEASLDNTVIDYLNIFKGIIDSICRAYGVSNLEDINPDKLDGKLKEFYNSYIKSFIDDNVNKLQKYLNDNNIKWVDVDGKPALDFGDIDEKDYKTHFREIIKLIHTDKFNELKQQFDLLKNTAEKVDKVDDVESIFTKLFNGEDLSEDETKQLSEYLKKKFTNLSDDDIKEIISKIDELADKSKDEQTNESLIDESVSDNDILNNLKQLRDYLNDKANNWEKKHRDTDKEYGVESGKHAYAGNTYTNLLQIFKTDIKKYDAKSDINNTKDKILSDAELNAVSYFFQQNIFTDFTKGIKNLKEAFIGIIELKNWLLEHKDEEITDEVKALYLSIISIFERSKIFKNDVEEGKFKKLNFDDVDDSTKEKMQQKLDQKVDDVSDKQAKADFEDVKSQEPKDNNLLLIYKKLIKAFSKDSQFKDDVKNNEYELLDGVSIEESFKTLFQYLLLEKLEKSDFRKNLVKLKNYLLKKVNALTKKEKGEITKSDEKHGIIPLSSKDFVKSMGATYKPEKKNKDNGVLVTTIDPNEPIKQLPAPITSKDDQNNQDNSSNNDKTDESDGKEVPVLMLANNYGIDLASATKSGPRKDAYALKGIFDSLTFSTFEGGTSVDNITKMLGDILHAQTNNLMSVSANRPCNQDEKSKKFILNDKFNKEDDERPDFGMLTNQEITDILNKPENAVKFIKGKSSKYTIAQTEEDKKLQDEKKNEFKGKLEKPDEKTVKLVKEIDPELVDNGKIKDTDKLSDTLSNYYLAKHKAKGAKKSGGGLFSKLKNFVKGLFGGNKDEGKKYNSLLNHFEESLYDNDNLINENLKENNKFLNECFGIMSLSEYIKLKR